MKRKEDSKEKERKQKESTSCYLPFKWHWLYLNITKLSKTENFLQKYSLFDLLYTENSIDNLSSDIFFRPNPLKNIPSFLVISQNESKMSILLDTVHFRLQHWGWSYLTQEELVLRCPYSCCFNRARHYFPPWLKRCKCFTPRVGQCHFVCPGTILAPGVLKVPKGEIFNQKYWELFAGGKVQGIVLSITSISSIQSIVYSMVKFSDQTQEYLKKFVYVTNKTIEQNIINKPKECVNKIELKPLPYNGLETKIQKIFHLCHNYSRFCKSSEFTEIPNSNLKKSNLRNKFHRGKNSKIKGKTFCYYCSGHNFKHYSLDTFFSEVNSQNKGNLIEKNVYKLPLPIRKYTENVSEKMPQSETEFEENFSKICSKNLMTNGSKREHLIEDSSTCPHILDKTTTWDETEKQKGETLDATMDNNNGGTMSGRINCKEIYSIHNHNKKDLNQEDIFLDDSLETISKKGYTTENYTNAQIIKKRQAINNGILSVPETSQNEDILQMDYKNNERDSKTYNFDKILLSSQSIINDCIINLNRNHDERSQMNKNDMIPPFPHQYKFQTEIYESSGKQNDDFSLKKSMNEFSIGGYEARRNALDMNKEHIIENNFPSQTYIKYMKEKIDAHHIRDSFSYTTDQEEF